MWNLLTSLVSIQARSVTTGANGNAYTYTTTYSNVPMSVQPGGAPTSLTQDGRKVIAQYSMYTTQAITANPGDRVLFGTRKFVIQHVKNLQEQNRVFVIDCYEFFDDA